MNFLLMTSDLENNKVVITARLWVCHAELNPEMYNDITKKLQKVTAKYYEIGVLLS